MHVYAKTYALNRQTFKTSLYRSSRVIGVEAYRATLKGNANALTYKAINFKLLAHSNAESTHQFHPLGSQDQLELTKFLQSQTSVFVLQMRC